MRRTVVSQNCHRRHPSDIAKPHPAYRVEGDGPMEPNGCREPDKSRLDSPKVLPKGASADYACYVLYGRQYLGSGCGTDRPDWMYYPHDIGDFGRLYGFLESNGFLSRVTEMAYGGTQWRAIVAHWDELVALYRLEKHRVPDGGGCGPTYAFNRRLKELVVRDFDVVMETFWTGPDGRKNVVVLDGTWSEETDVFFDGYVRLVSGILRSRGLDYPVVRRVFELLAVSKKDFSNETKQAIYDAVVSRRADS